MTSVNNFKQGDKVLCIDNDYVETYLTKGNIYIVYRILVYLNKVTILADNGYLENLKPERFILATINKEIKSSKYALWIRQVELDRK